MKLEIKDLRKNFKNNNALNNISLNFESNRIYAIIGRNGSGKTVLLKILSGYFEKSSGKIKINGNDVNPYTEIMNRGVFIDGPSFVDDLTGFENLHYLSLIKKEINADQINKLLEDFGLDEVSNVKYKNYSLGMKQKLGIIQAIMEHPNIILLDEPFNSIDRESVEQIKKIIKRYRDDNTIIIVTSHVEDDIKNFADVVYKLSDGNVVC